MMPAAQSRSATYTSEQAAALASIEAVLDLCRSATPEPVIKYEMRELIAIRAAVEQEWPLPSEYKQQISIGPFAAKNIADWDAELANALMSLDHALQHDIADADIKRSVKSILGLLHSAAVRSA